MPEGSITFRPSGHALRRWHERAGGHALDARRELLAAMAESRPVPDGEALPPFLNRHGGCRLYHHAGHGVYFVVRHDAAGVAAVLSVVKPGFRNHLRSKPKQTAVAASEVTVEVAAATKASPTPCTILGRIEPPAWSPPADKVNLSVAPAPADLTGFSVARLAAERDRLAGAVADVQAALGVPRAIKGWKLKAHRAWRERAVAALHGALAELRRVKSALHAQVEVEDAARRYAECEAGGLTPTRRKAIDVLCGLVDALSGHDLGDPVAAGLLEEGRTLVTLHRTRLAAGVA